MRWEEIDKHWKQFERIVRYRWKMLTENDLEQINGNKDMLSSKLQGRYRRSKREADKSISNFLSSFNGVLAGKTNVPRRVSTLSPVKTKSLSK